MENQYTKIIPTAWIVAYRRKYSNIPFYITKIGFIKLASEKSSRLSNKSFFRLGEHLVIH